MSDLVDEYATLEQQADALLQEVDPEGTDRTYALTRQMRTTLKRHRKELERVRSEVAAEVRAEMATAYKTEAAFRRLDVPPSARMLFEGVDVGDEQAMQARADELKAAGLSWGPPPPPAPKPVDPNLQAQLAMMRASAGGGHPDAAGDLKARMLDMEANPAKYSQSQIDSVVREYNDAVMAAGRHGTSGARG